MHGTSGTSCHSAPFLNDLSLVLARLVGIGQTKGREPVSIFSPSLQLDLGGERAGLLLTLGAPSVSAT